MGMKKIVIILFVLLLGVVLAFGGAQQEKTEKTTGATGAPATKYSEAPMLSKLVASGQLPDVDQRLPLVPKVVQPVGEIGKYGGTLQQVRDLNNSDWLAWVITKEPLVLVAHDYSATPPNVALEYKVSEDGKVTTFKLREGLKWSDGQSFTAEDVMFWYEDIITNTDLTPSPFGPLTRDGQLAQVSRIDDYTVSFSFDKPYSVFVELLGTWYMYFFPQYAPKHYLQQFHPNHVSQADLDKKVKAEGFNSWVDLFNSKNNVNNPDCPTVGAWIFIDPKTAPAQKAVRNPYYFKVDPEGNQLPYIDNVERPLISDPEAWLLKVVAGEEDVVLGSFLDPGKNYTFLKENEQRGNYRVGEFLWWKNISSIYFNYTSDDEVRNKLYSDKRFRIALSVAINRDEINNLLYRGQYTPTQLRPSEGPPFHGERDMFAQYTEFDLSQANDLLDEVGLAERGRDGFRLGPDGKPLQVIVIFPGWPPENPDLAELIKGYWAKIGINLAVKAMSDEAYSLAQEADEYDLAMRIAYFGGPPMVMTMSPYLFTLGEIEPQWQLWLDTDGAEGVQGPDDAKRLRELQTEILGETDEDGRLALYEQTFKIHTDNFWCIGILEVDTRTMYSYVANNRIGNVPNPMPGEIVPALRSTWYIKE